MIPVIVNDKVLGCEHLMWWGRVAGEKVIDNRKRRMQGIERSQY